MSDLAFTMDSSPRQLSRTVSESSRNEIKAAKLAALRLLSRREYSRLELFRKLSQRFSSSDAVTQVLDQLEDQGYQSDARFTESYIRSKVSGGNGPFKIKIGLRERGVCESTSLSVFDRLDIDWLHVAKQAATKRFSSTQYIHERLVGNFAEDLDTHSAFNEYAKKVRYLKNRGFYQEHIDEIIKTPM